MHHHFHTTVACAVLAFSTASAHAAIRWAGERLADGTLQFVAQDLVTGLEHRFELDSSQLRADRPIMLSLDVDPDSGRQGMGLVWTGLDGLVQAHRIDLDNVVDEDFDPNKARFRANADQVVSSRTSLAAVDAMARLEVNSTGDPGWLFDVLQTDAVQSDPEHGLPGDLDADGTVRVHDLLQVVSAWAASCLPEDVCAGDANGDSVVNVADLLLVLLHLGETSAQEVHGPSRLIHFQLVGGSYDLSDPNRIHPLIYNDEQGWNALIENNLEAIHEVAPDGWDLWLHNPAGYWYDHDFTWRAPEGQTQPMVFEQFDFARQQRPGLLELDPVRHWMEARGGRMYGYVGMPRSFESPTGDWSLMSDHGAPGMVDRWYGDLLQQGFRGIGHDASAHHPADSVWVTDMMPELRARGIEVFLESIPMRSKPHLLGQSVVAEHRLWESFAQPGTAFFTQVEIEAAGGRAIHLVTWPLGMHPEDAGFDPEFDVQQWQLDTSVALLEAGQTVAVNLAGLVRHGYDIAPIIAAGL